MKATFLGYIRSELQYQPDIYNGEILGLELDGKRHLMVCMLPLPSYGEGANPAVLGEILLGNQPL